MLFSAADAFRRFFSKPRSSGSSFRVPFTSRLFPAALLAVASVATHGQSATATALAVTSGSGTVTTVTLGTVVTLTATVTAGATPVTVGQVNFCDALASYCTDIRLLGTEQLTSAGTAVYKFRPGVGSHSYKAVFLGTPHGATDYMGSASSAAALTVTEGLRLTATTLAKDYSENNANAPYPLAVTVGGTGSTAPSGTVSFVNLSGAKVEGTATLGAGQSQLSLLNTLTPTQPAELGYAKLIVTGDFNGDGIPDVAAGGGGVILGDGKGGFTNTWLSASLGGYALAAADFNGDGKLDLAIAAVPSNNAEVQIFLGNGDGTFTPAATPAVVGLWPAAMAVADFNGDGIPDIGVLATNSRTVSILLGNGDGTFTASPASPLTDIQPQSIASGDFNGDGNPDLVVANGGSGADSIPGSLTVLLGNGDGTFVQPTTSLPLGQANDSAVSVVTGDFNRDGNLDLAVGSSLGAIFIFLGDGHGGFTAPTVISSGGGEPKSMVVGDFNQDGIPDLAVTNIANINSNAVTVIPGNGDGTFSTSLATAAVAPDTDLEAIAAADFNGDGYPDLISANTFNLSLLITATEIATASESTPLTLPPGQGTANIIADYLGDSNYGPSISLKIALAEQLYVPTVTVAPSSSSITTSQSLPVAITVSGGVNPTPTGTVILNSVNNTNTDYTSAAWTLSGGAQSITIPAGALKAGVNTLSAVYVPDTNSSTIYNEATGSAAVTVIVPSFTLSGTAVSVPMAGTGATSTVTVTPAGGFTGSVALTATVTSSPAGAASLPTSSFGSTSPVSITGTGAGTAALSVSTTAATSPGVYEITVTGTSGSVTATTSIPVTVPIGMAAATVTVTPSLTPITNAQVESVAITVAGGSGQATPTGTVTLASGSYSAQQALASGAASFSIAAGTLSVGSDTLTASYSGDGTYASATGTASVTVSPVTMSIASPAAVSPGTSATATVTLNASSTYSGTLNLTCALTQSPSGAQSLPTCSLNPASATLAAGGSGTTMLTVKTTAASTSALERPLGVSPWRLGGDGAALAGVLLLAIPFRRRRWLGTLVLMLIAVGTFAAGCGGGSSHSPPVQTTPGTTAGNYVFKVTGTDSSNANVTESASVTVVVQ
jgi:hypothetical protein